MNATEYLLDAGYLDGRVSLTDVEAMLYQRRAVNGLQPSHVSDGYVRATHVGTPRHFWVFPDRSALFVWYASWCVVDRFHDGGTLILAH